MSTDNKEAMIRQAILDLPSYEAPSNVWSAIYEQLEVDQKDGLIQQAIPGLSSHAAPAAIWAGIADQLDRTPTKKPGRIIRLMRHPISWAASIALVLFAFFWLNQSTTSATYSYNTEVANPYLLEADWDADETEFAEVIQLYQKYLATFQDSNGAELQEEFSELNEARTELKNTLEQYGKDQELIRQLAAIERARTQVIKQMAQKI